MGLRQYYENYKIVSIPWINQLRFCIKLSFPWAAPSPVRYSPKTRRFFSHLRTSASYMAAMRARASSR